MKQFRLYCMYLTLWNISDSYENWQKKRAMAEQKKKKEKNIWIANPNDMASIAVALSLCKLTSRLILWKIYFGSKKTNSIDNASTDLIQNFISLQFYLPETCVQISIYVWPEMWPKHFAYGVYTRHQLIKVCLKKRLFPFFHAWNIYILFNLRDWFFLTWF